MKKILAIGIMVLLMCGVVLVMAQNRSKNEVARTSLGAAGKKNYTYDEDEITKLRQEIETQMREYTWADEIAYDLITGKYDRPPGARAEEFLPLNENILALLPNPVPALPVQPRTSQTTSTPEPTSWGPLPPNFKEMEEKIVPKFEEIEMKINESATVKGNLIKLISIEKEDGIVKIEVKNETTGKPMVVPLKFYGGAFKYKNIAIIPLPDTIKNDRITFLIAEVAYNGADTQSP